MARKWLADRISIFDLAREYLADTYARDSHHREFYLALTDDEVIEKMVHSDYPGGWHAFRADNGQQTEPL